MESMAHRHARDQAAHPGQRPASVDRTVLCPGLAAESIDGPEVRVRRYRDEDVPDVQAGCDDPLTQRFLPMLPQPYTREDAIWWVAEGSAAEFAHGGGNFAIADPATDRLVGGIGITHHRDGTGEIGYWVAPWARRRGIATAATKTLTDYAFSVAYGRLQLRTALENTLSQRVAIAAGYRWEAVQRASAPARDGSRYDLVVWARVNGDPPGPTPRVLPDLPGGQLADGIVVLRPLEASDAVDAHDLRCHPDVAASKARPTLPTAAETTRSCTEAGAYWLAGSAARLTIRDRATGTFAGEITLTYHAPLIGEGTIGYAVAPAWRGRGFATRATRLLSRWALIDAGLARLTAGAAPHNLASQRVLEASGFTREGYQRGHLPGPGGGRTDVITYGLLTSDLIDRG